VRQPPYLLQPLIVIKYIALVLLTLQFYRDSIMAPPVREQESTAVTGIPHAENPDEAGEILHQTDAAYRQNPDAPPEKG